VVLLAVLALGAYLRFEGLGEPSLWLDEILHYGKTQEAASEPWHSWLTGVSADRENGSLYYAGQLFAFQLFDGELAVRFMPAFVGVATVFVMFLIGLSATGSRRVGTVAAALLAISPLHVYYSREGRPYAAVMLVAALLLLLALEHKRPWTRIAVYGLCIATAYLGAVAAPVLISCAVLGSLEWLRSRKGGPFVLASGAGLAISLLLFPTAERLGGAVGALNNTARWEITKPLSGEAFDRLLASLTVSGLDRGTATSLSFVFLALAIWGGISLALRRPRQALWVAGMGLLPIAGWLAILLAFDHWYNVRYTSVGLPGFLALVALGIIDLWQRGERGIQTWTRRKATESRLRWVTDPLLALVLVLLLAPSWRTARAEPLEKPDWRGVAKLIGSLALPDEPVIARGPWAATCIRHYLGSLSLPLEVFSVNYDPGRAAELTERYPRAWVLSAGYRETPEFRAWTRSLDPILRKRLANLQLFYSPDFSTFLSEPQRIGPFSTLLAQEGGSLSKEDFTQSELLLGTGWSYPEKAPDGMTFRWALGDRAEIALPGAPGEKVDSLRLKLLPFPSPYRPQQEVAIAINAQPLTRITLEADWQEITVPVTIETEGPRLITFEFAWSQSPRELDPGSGDPRRLAVAFDFVEVNAPPSP